LERFAIGLIALGIGARIIQSAQDFLVAGDRKIVVDADDVTVSVT
jgi:hypothetical protein